jgi:hypothetical protein
MPRWPERTFDEMVEFRKDQPAVKSQGYVNYVDAKVLVHHHFSLMKALDERVAELKEFIAECYDRELKTGEDFEPDEERAKELRRELKSLEDGMSRLLAHAKWSSN